MFISSKTEREREREHAQWSLFFVEFCFFDFFFLLLFSPKRREERRDPHHPSFVSNEGEIRGDILSREKTKKREKNIKEREKSNIAS